MDVTKIIDPVAYIKDVEDALKLEDRKAMEAWANFRQTRDDRYLIKGPVSDRRLVTDQEGTSEVPSNTAFVYAGTSPSQPGEMTQEEFDAFKLDFHEPPTVTPKGEKNPIFLNVDYQHHIIGEDKVKLRTYSFGYENDITVGKLIGPTIVCKPGDDLRITINNNLPEEPYAETINILQHFSTTNLHTHGLHVDPTGTSDNVLTPIFPGRKREYKIEIPKTHGCGTYWYHAHYHGSTAGNVASGMAGALIIKDNSDNDVAKVLDPAITERIFLFQQIPYFFHQDEKTKEFEKEGTIEAIDHSQIFGPGPWDDVFVHPSGTPSWRYPTINGVKKPVIKMRPGSMERWRLIHGGIHQAFVLELVKVTLKTKVGEPQPKSEQLEFNEIAVDGIPLGRVRPALALELWPGYRSDVLVQVPAEATAGTFYVLLDTREDLKGPNDRKFLALIQIEGEKVEKAPSLPKDEKLKRYRPPSIDPTKVTGYQTATYGILQDGPAKFNFTINGAAFPGAESHNQRILIKGDVDEWTVLARNRFTSFSGGPTHPLHIHVNSFEVFSILELPNEKNGFKVTERLEQIDDPEHPNDPSRKITLPVWHDTIALKEGQKVMFRTKYEDFTGLFVQHCHLLDHEDQGMMELVIIKDPPAAPKKNNVLLSSVNPETTTIIDGTAKQDELTQMKVKVDAPDFTVFDVDGKSFSWKKSGDSANKTTTVLFLFLGSECLACLAQIQEFMRRYSEFKAAGIELIGISCNTVQDLVNAKKTLDVPFGLYADPSLRVFREYGAYIMGPLHGTFVISQDHHIEWQNVSTLPFTNIDDVLKKANAVQKGKNK